MRISDWSSDVCSAELIPDVSIRAWVEAIGGDRIDYARFDPKEIDRNPFCCPDAEAAERWEELIDRTRKAGSSIGAVVACEATGVPAGWGAPISARQIGRPSCRERVCQYV